MNNIDSVRQIAKMLIDGKTDLGRVNVKKDDGYFLLSYTNEAQYGEEPFTAIERACRGLVIRNDGKIMALPMEKFFNLGEPQCKSLPDEPYQVWEKVDGSLGVFWYEYSNDPKKPSCWRCNTRGSFSNTYIDFAMNWWNQHVDQSGIPSNYTIMVEICIDDDEMSRAAKKPQGLYLIACRDRNTGKDIPITELNVDGLLPIQQEQHKSINKVLEARDTEEGTEGWVIRFESGFRIKIKTTWYLKLFRAIHFLNPNKVREMMLEDPSGKWRNDIPDDLQPQITEMQETINERLAVELARINEAYSTIQRIESRKDFALAVMRDYKGISKWLFALRDGKLRQGDVLRKMDL